MELLSRNKENGSSRQLFGNRKFATGRGLMTTAFDKIVLTHPLFVSTFRLVLYIPADAYVCEKAVGENTSEVFPSPKSHDHFTMLPALAADASVKVMF